MKRIERTESGIEIVKIEEIERRKERLAKARSLRQQNSKTLAAIRNGDVYIGDVLEDPPDTLKNVRVGVILKNVPKLGEKGIQRIFRKLANGPGPLGISTLDPLHTLSEDQRLAILRNLPARVRRYASDP